VQACADHLVTLVLVTPQVTCQRFFQTRGSHCLSLERTADQMCMHLSINLFCYHYYYYSLYTPRVNEIAPKQYVYDSNAVIGRHTAAPTGISYMPYLHETPCSWGAVYYPEVLQHTYHFMPHRSIHFQYAVCCAYDETTFVQCITQYNEAPSLLCESVPRIVLACTGRGSAAMTRPSKHHCLGMQHVLYLQLCAMLFDTQLQAWMEFRAYLAARLHEDHIVLHIPAARLV
jgi:hypothetical protein